MIVDRIEFASKYHDVAPGIETGLRFLAEHDLSSLDLGRHEIDGDRVFALVSSYTTKPRSEGAWEAHRGYIDIQYMVSGDETMGYTEIGRLSPTTEYDESKDILFLKGEGGAFVHVAPGTFIIFYPQDAHMPGLYADGPDNVRKVVVKVRV